MIRWLENLLADVLLAIFAAVSRWFSVLGGDD